MQVSCLQLPLACPEQSTCDFWDFTCNLPCTMPQRAWTMSPSSTALPFSARSSLAFLDFAPNLSNEKLLSFLQRKAAKEPLFCCDVQTPPSESKCVAMTILVPQEGLDASVCVRVLMDILQHSLVCRTA